MSRVNSNFDKCRNVMFLVYPDDWGKPYGELLEYLDGLAIKCACSPIHDQDKYTQEDVNKWVRKHTDSDGNVDKEAIARGIPEVDQAKKKHVHVMICADGPQTASWFYQLMLPFHEVTYFEKVNSVSAQLRYFAHMNSPQKHRYSELDIHGFGGIDMSCLLKLDDVSNLEVLLDVLDYIQVNDVRHYNKLVNWAVSTGEMDTIACVTGRASMFANYFKGGSDERKEKYEKQKRERENANGSSAEIDF